MKWNRYIIPRMTKADKRKVYHIPKPTSKILLAFQQLIVKIRDKIQW